MVKMKVGAITIGQSPRADVVQELLPLMGEQVELIQAGALDGLTREDIQAFAPGPEDYIYVNLATSGRKFGYVCRTAYSAPAAAVYRSAGKAGRKFDSVFVHGGFSGCISF